MDVASYTQSRYGRLLEHAVELGAPDGLASAYVDQVLLDQRRRIKRAFDPDPLVREALAKAIRGERDQSRGLMAVVVVVAAVLASVGLAAIVYSPPPRALPSLFGYTGDQARQLLESEGYDVVVRPARSCEPQDLVLATTPRVGEVVPHGSGVTVRTAVPSGDDCPVSQQDSSDAWDVVAWAEGVGPAPALAEDVTVVVDGEPREGTDGVRRLLTATARRPAPTRTGMPSLVVTSGVPPSTSCGYAVPAALAGRESLRLAVGTAPDDETAGCPLTVDLYRTDGVIDAVVARTAAGVAP